MFIVGELFELFLVRERFDYLARRGVVVLIFPHSCTQLVLQVAHDSLLELIAEDGFLLAALHSLAQFFFVDQRALSNRIPTNCAFLNSPNTSLFLVSCKQKLKFICFLPISFGVDFPEERLVIIVAEHGLLAVNILVPFL